MNDNTTFQEQETTNKPKPSYQNAWDYDDEDDDDELDMEIGIQKTISQKQKSLNSQDIQRNINQILGDDDEEYQINTKKDFQSGSKEDSMPKGRGFHNQADDRNYHDDSRQGPGTTSERHQRPQHVPRQKYEDKDIDQNTNFRKYYLKDKHFYMKVIDREDPGEGGYKFKIHVFSISEDAKELQDQEKNVFFALAELNAEDIRIKVLPDKFRVFCRVPKKEDAKKMYHELQTFLDDPMRAAVFLDFPEELFVKHGDIEAENYYKQQEENQKYHQEKQNYGRYDTDARGGYEQRQSYDQRQYQQYDKYQGGRSNYQNDNYNQSRDNYQQDSRGKYQKDFKHPRRDNQYPQQNYHNESSQYNSQEEQKMEAEKIGIKFGGKPQFFKGANPNEDRDDHRRVYNTAKKDIPSNSNSNDQQQVRTVVQQEYPQQNRQVEYKNQSNSNYYESNKKSYNQNTEGQNYPGLAKGYSKYQDNRGYDNQRDSNYKQNQQNRKYPNSRGLNNNRDQKFNDSQSNYDYETHSQISDTLSHHSFKTDNQGYVKGRRQQYPENTQNKQYQNYDDRKGSQTFSQQNYQNQDSRFQNQRGDYNQGHGGQPTRGYNQQQRTSGYNKGQGQNYNNAGWGNNQRGQTNRFQQYAE